MRDLTAPRVDAGIRSTTSPRVGIWIAINMGGEPGAEVPPTADGQRVELVGLATDDPPTAGDGSVRLGGTRPYSVGLIVLVIAAIQLAMPQSVTLGKVWMIPFFELVGAPLILVIVTRGRQSRTSLRVAAGVYLIMIISVTILNAVLLFRTLLTPAADSGVVLLLAGLGVLAINVLSFGLVYWWVDGGGPLARRSGTVKRWDFQFPQQASDEQDWQAEINDYIYTAYTNIVAFSPTDTMPLTRRVKNMFLIQSAVALLTIVVTVSRAINLLPY